MSVVGDDWVEHVQPRTRVNGAGGAMDWMGKGVPEAGIQEMKNEAQCHVGSLHFGGYAWLCENQETLEMGSPLRSLLLCLFTWYRCGPIDMPMLSSPSFAFFFRSSFLTAKPCIFCLC